MKAKGSTLYAPGVYREKGLALLACEGDTVRTATYEVRQMCCDRTEVLKHPAVRERMKSPNGTLCRYCSARKVAKETRTRGWKRSLSALSPGEIESLERLLTHEGMSYRKAGAVMKRSPATLRREAEARGFHRTNAERTALRRACRSESLSATATERAYEARREVLRDRKPRPARLWLLAMLDISHC